MNQTTSMFFLFLVFLLTCVTIVEGCQCDKSPNPPCRAYGDSPHIFEGTVTSFEDLGPNNRRVTFDRVRSYKGVNSNRIILHTGDGGSDCGYTFAVAKRYLVYAYGQEDEITTSYCTRTRPIEYASEDLAFFGNVPTLPNGGYIFGSVKKYALGWGNYGQDEDFGLTAPLRNILVSINGPKKVQRRTDAKGEFRVDGLPAGEYYLELKLPKNLQISANSPLMPVDVVKILDRGCAGAKYYLDFEGEISGRVLDAKGQGVAGLDVTLVSADYKFKGINDTAPLLDWTVSRQDGRYVLDGIPPGRYRLGIGIGGAFTSFGQNGQVFFPNTTDANKARILTVVEGTPLRNINLPVPKKGAQ
jgi:hypothetical protein